MIKANATDDSRQIPQNQREHRDVPVKRTDCEKRGEDDHRDGMNKRQIKHRCDHQKQRHISNAFMSVLTQSQPSFPKGFIHSAGRNIGSVEQVCAQTSGTVGSGQHEAIVQRTADRGMSAGKTVCTFSGEKQLPAPCGGRASIGKSHHRKRQETE